MGSFPTMTCEQYLTSSFPIRMAYYWARHPLNIAFGYLTIFHGWNVFSSAGQKS
jgi:hypothetical protein